MGRRRRRNVWWHCRIDSANTLHVTSSLKANVLPSITIKSFFPQFRRLWHWNVFTPLYLATYRHFFNLGVASSFSTIISNWIRMLRLPPKYWWWFGKNVLRFNYSIKYEWFQSNSVSLECFRWRRGSRNAGFTRISDLLLWKLEWTKWWKHVWSWRRRRNEREWASST